MKCDKCGSTDISTHYRADRDYRFKFDPFEYWEKSASDDPCTPLLEHLERHCKGCLRRWCDHCDDCQCAVCTTTTIEVKPSGKPMDITFVDEGAKA